MSCYLDTSYLPTWNLIFGNTDIVSRWVPTTVLTLNYLLVARYLGILSKLKMAAFPYWSFLELVSKRSLPTPFVLTTDGFTQIGITKLKLYPQFG
jgi:hypothetical protein